MYYGYDLSPNDYRLYLIHHGVKGQKWGDRNGPPYPLSRIAKAKAYGSKKVRDIKNGLEGKRKQQTTKVENSKEETKRIANTAVEESKLTDINNAGVEIQKEKKTGDVVETKKKNIMDLSVNELLRNERDYTTKEISDYINRVTTLNNLKTLDKQQHPDIWAKMNNVTKKMTTVHNMLSTANNIKKLLSGDKNNNNENNTNSKKKSEPVTSESKPNKTHTDTSIKKSGENKQKDTKIEVSKANNVYGDSSWVNEPERAPINNKKAYRKATALMESFAANSKEYIKTDSYSVTDSINLLINSAVQSAQFYNYEDEQRKK